MLSKQIHLITQQKQVNGELNKKANQLLDQNDQVELEITDLQNLIYENNIKIKQEDCDAQDLEEEIMKQKNTLSQQEEGGENILANIEEIQKQSSQLNENIEEIKVGVEQGKYQIETL